MTEMFKSCPRCKGKKVIDLGETIECTVCRLEFDKDDIEQLEDKATILSVQEKLKLVKSIKPNKS